MRRRGNKIDDAKRRRRRVEPTDDWEQLKLLCLWPEQLAYEEIRPTALFGVPVSERAQETGSSERTLYRKVSRFEAEGVDSLFAAGSSKRRGLPPAVRRLVVDLKAEHPPMRPHEIATVCYVRFGRRPDYRTVERVLAEEPMPLRIMRRFPPYHEMVEPRERRMAVVRLHAEGWNVKSIASYLKTARSTVYRALKQWIEEGVEGLDDRPNTGGGVRKADLKAYAAVRRIQENPELGAFRVRAALAREGIHLSVRTVGRILAVNRRIYGLKKPKGPAKEKKEMPFKAERRHQYWSSDVRHLDVVDEGLVGSKAYAVTILDNYSRAVVANSVSPTQDLSAFLSVLHRAVERHGPPEALVTDSRAVFRANRAGGLRGFGHREARDREGRALAILPGDGVQRATPDGGLALRESGELAGTARRAREVGDGVQRPVPPSSREAHGWAAFSGGGARDLAGGAPAADRPRPGVLRRALRPRAGPLGVRRMEAVEGLWRGGFGRSRGGAVAAREDPHGRARRRAFKSLRGGVRGRHGQAAGRRTSRAFRNRHPAQPKLFGLASLGEGGWLKAVWMEDYAPRGTWPESLQQTLFPYHEA